MGSDRQTTYTSVYSVLVIHHQSESFKHRHEKQFPSKIKENCEIVFLGILKKSRKIFIPEPSSSFIHVNTRVTNKRDQHQESSTTNLILCAELVDEGHQRLQIFPHAMACFSGNGADALHVGTMRLKMRFIARCGQFTADMLHQFVESLIVATQYLNERRVRNGEI